MSIYILILRILCNVLEIYFMYSNTLLLGGSSIIIIIIIIIIASIDVDNTLEMYFSATLCSSTTTYDCNSISK
jgi:hypothetical protein